MLRNIALLGALALGQGLPAHANHGEIYTVKTNRRLMQAGGTMPPSGDPGMAGGNQTDPSTSGGGGGGGGVTGRDNLPGGLPTGIAPVNTTVAVPAEMNLGVTGAFDSSI